MKPKICFIVILLFVSSCNAKTGASKGKPKSGPYKSRLLKIGPCVKPTRPYDDNPGVMFSGEVYNTSKKHFLLRGNITVVNANKNLVLTMKSFFWEDGKWKLTYVFNNAGCNSRWIRILDLFGVGANVENCVLSKGVYGFENVEQNMIEHLWSSTREYGKMMWRTETFYKRKTWICAESLTEVVPA